jgi:hypothetical protein
MASKFTTTEWNRISSKFDSAAEDFGLPTRRARSVVIGTFNIRKLGRVKNRSTQSWQLLRNIVQRFDLIAIQEVMDDLSGITHLQELAGDDYGIVVSDVTGVKPGAAGNPERLAYLFNWRRIQRTALASDITYDRSEIAKVLYENSIEFDVAWKRHAQRIGNWEEKARQRKEEGKRSPSKPPIQLPRFVSFIRQPHYVSFRIPGTQNAAPYEFLAVNAHLLYGEKPEEREWEFRSLIEWMTVRAKKADRLYHPNLLLLGDCNLDFDNSVSVMRDDIDSMIKSLNNKYLKSKKAATANFPLLTPHPKHGVLRTALRQGQTYDQIGLFARDTRLPKPEDNAAAGNSADGFDYGVFNIAELIAHALHNTPIEELTKAQQRSIYKKSEFDISDHMPAWIRLKRPTAAA